MGDNISWNMYPFTIILTEMYVKCGLFATWNTEPCIQIQVVRVPSL